MLSLFINAGCKGNENYSTRNIQKILHYKENSKQPPHENLAKCTQVAWKSVQSSAVVCLNKKFSLGVCVPFEKREVLIDTCISSFCEG